MSNNNAARILIAEDDPEDRDLLMAAFRNTGFDRLEWVGDGADLDDYLHGRKQDAKTTQPPPSLILMDLNMPRVDGLEATAKIKADPRFRQIPVVVFTTSSAPDDVHRAYAAGANSYITKPAEFSGLLKVTAVLRQYWTEIVTLPVTGQQPPN